ncbi:uncharacterized protein ACNLHF_027381 [Anomaloglossus baeobatrachus]|uniref:uncharacterized protein LOC142249311 n=1 Tax=Anomaloglossus baeobatrachus TaxID=238106 RepID=UPI003F502640
MKIWKVLITVMVCAYGQIANTMHYEEFIDPMDMEHYDQSTKSMKFTLKEKKSLELFKELLQGLLKNANERELKAVMDIDIELEINKFLNNENWDSDKMQIILENVAFTEHKGDLEKESVELFKGLLQRLLNNAVERDLKAVMDIDIELEINKFLNNENWDSDKLQIILENVAFTEHKGDLEKESVELFKGLLQRLLNNADERGLKVIMDIDIKMEIDKCLNDGNCDFDKLHIILYNVAFTEDKEDWLWTLILGGVILCALPLLMKIYSWLRPAQNEVINEADEPEDDTEYIEDQMSTPTPETGQIEVFQLFINERRSNPDPEQNEKDKCSSQHSQTSHKFTQTQDGSPNESHKQENFPSMEVNRANVPMNQNEEHADISNVEQFSIFQALAATGRSEASESVRSEIQTAPGILQDEEDLYSVSPSEESLNNNQARLCGRLNQSSSSPNVEIKDNAFVETDQTLSQTLSSEKKQVVTSPGAKEPNDTPAYNPELLSSDAEGSSENQWTVDSACSTHHSQDNSMTGDEESFIVLYESAPESLNFIKNEDCAEML